MRREKEPQIQKVVLEEKRSNLHLPPSMEMRYEQKNDIEIFKRTEKEKKKPERPRESKKTKQYIFLHNCILQCG